MAKSNSACCRLNNEKLSLPLNTSFKFLSLSPVHVKSFAYFLKFNKSSMNTLFVTLDNSLENSDNFRNT